MSTEDDRYHHIEKQLDHIEDRVNKIDEKQDIIERELAGYKGAIGGALVIVTSLIAFIKLVWGWIREHVVIQ
jgi:hypothetical protein